MSRPQLFRSIAVLVGATVLFGLELGLDVAVYIAIPAGILAYTACRLGLEMLSADTPAK